MPKAINAKHLFGEDLKWCFAFESKLETIRILCIVGSALTEKGRKHKRNLEQYVITNGDNYLQLINNI